MDFPWLSSAFSKKLFIISSNDQYSEWNPIEMIPMEVMAAELTKYNCPIIYRLQIKYYNGIIITLNGIHLHKTDLGFQIKVFFCTVAYWLWLTACELKDLSVRIFVLVNWADSWAAAGPAVWSEHQCENPPENINNAVDQANQTESLLWN